MTMKFKPVIPPPAPNPYSDVLHKGRPGNGSPNSFNPFTEGSQVEKPAGGKIVPGMALKGTKKLDPKMLAAIMRRLAEQQNRKGS